MARVTWAEGIFVRPAIADAEDGLQRRLIWEIHWAGALVHVEQDGSWAWIKRPKHEPAPHAFEAAVSALAEWMRIDRTVFAGENAEKLRAELLTGTRLTSGSG